MFFFKLNIFPVFDLKDASQNFNYLPNLFIQMYFLMVKLNCLFFYLVNHKSAYTGLISHC